MFRSIMIILIMVLVFGTVPLTLAAQDSGNLLDIMKIELDRSMENLKNASEHQMYFLQYSVIQEDRAEITMSNGGFDAPEFSQDRYLDVDVRVGAMELDNTHEIRGGNWRDNYTPRRVNSFPLETDADAVRAALWAETEYQYQKAKERYTKVLTNRQVKVEEEDLSSDFSPSEPNHFEEQTISTNVDVAAWKQIIKPIGLFLMEFPFVYESQVGLSITDKATYMVNSDGCRLQHGNNFVRLRIEVSGMAEDGMDLSRGEIFTSFSLEKLPDEETLMVTAERLVDELKALINAPLVEPYIGPAILRNRASGVFFHEIFGHRIEGHRQKSESEGQTFTKKLDQMILPEFISVYDDPTAGAFNGQDLRGYFKYDDEGTPAQKVTVVENGVLKSFLTSRSPINNFPASNGHGRREYGYNIVSRQGNLIIKSSESVPIDKLRDLLIEECHKQDKPYGLIFEDISGGFTMTRRRGPQAFKVLPLMVYRVYADGRPDEVVRGVDIVGTPLTCFSKIITAGDDSEVFNGTCGAESGMVPVAAISPSILVSEIEVEKRFKGQEKPPILPPPLHDKEH